MKTRMTSEMAIDIDKKYKEIQELLREMNEWRPRSKDLREELKFLAVGGNSILLLLEFLEAMREICPPEKKEEMKQKEREILNLERQLKESMGIFKSRLSKELKDHL